jgi:citronellol/citronellal dehydrogenase
MPSNLFKEDLLRGHVALVSGGGSGIGRATALELASLGATVVICGRRPEPLAETAALSQQNPIDHLTADIRQEDQVDALVERTLERHGKIDLLVNNAGGQFLSPAEEITPKGFRTVIKLNVEGTWLMTHAVATKSMIPNRQGKIVSVTLSPHNGMPGMVHSGAARAAVENMMRTLAIEWSRFNIKCNSIAPGQIGTDTFMTKYPQIMVELMTQTIPLGRLGTAEEIAWMVAYLASPAGDFVSGTTLTIDGARDDWFGHWPPAPAADADGKPLVEQRRPSAEPPGS